MKEFFATRRLHDALTYEAYLAQWQERLRQPTRGLDRRERRYHFYRKYNWERAQRVLDAYEVSDALREAIEAVEKPQLWMVLTEDWCVDSAFTLPVIAEAVALNPRVDLRIVPRDANLDIMDAYLTRGTRGIPKLVVFEEEGAECFRWGPRPEAAHALREQLKQDAVPGAEISARLTEWYEAGGWHLVEAELVSLLVESSCLAET